MVGFDKNDYRWEKLKTKPKNIYKPQQRKAKDGSVLYLGKKKNIWYCKLKDKWYRFYP